MVLGHTPILLTVRPLDEKEKWQYKTEKEYLCIKDGEERGFNLIRSFAIKGSGRFIGQNHLGISSQRPRNSHTLFLPTGKIFCFLVCLFFNIKTTQHRERAHSLFWALS